MIERNNLYDDLKCLILDSGFVVENSDDCGFEEYTFVVRKQWLFEYYKNLCDHEVTIDDMENWLREEYIGDDAYLVYMSALASDEIIAESPVTSGKPVYREIFVVKSSGNCEGDCIGDTYLITTSKERAIKRYEEELAKVKSYDPDGWYFDVEELEDGMDDGLPYASWDSDDGFGDGFYIGVERKTLEDGGY